MGGGSCRAANACRLCSLPESVHDVSCSLRSFCKAPGSSNLPHDSGSQSSRRHCACEALILSHVGNISLPQCSSRSNGDVIHGYNTAIPRTGCARLRVAHAYPTRILPTCTSHFFSWRRGFTPGVHHPLIDFVNCRQSAVRWPRVSARNLLNNTCAGVSLPFELVLRPRRITPESYRLGLVHAIT